MDKMLNDLFGSDDAQQAAPAEATGDRQAEHDAQRAARREARQQRNADPERREKRRDFFDRYTTGNPSEGFTAEEALEHLQEMRDELSPAEFRQAMEQTIAHLPADQRDEFAALMRQQQAEGGGADPFGGLLGGLFGSGAAGGPAGVGIGDVLNDLRTGGLRAPSSGSGQPTAADFAALVNSPLGRAVLGGLAAYGMQAAQADEGEAPPRRTPA